MDDRGVSEVVGVLLTLVLVVFLVGILAGPALKSVEPDETQTFVRVSVNQTNVTIVNHGGDQLTLGEAQVVVRSEEKRATMSLDAGNITQHNQPVDSNFEVGERWDREHGLDLAVGDPVTVFLFTKNNRVAATWSGRVEDTE